MQIDTISAPSKIIEEKVIIKISSGDESSEHEVTGKDQKPTVSKKRSLSIVSNAEAGLPNKQQITTNVPVIEVLDSDDEHLNPTTVNLKLEVSTKATSLKPASNPNQHMPVKFEQGPSHEKVASELSSDRSPVAVDGAVRGKDGRFVLTQKVKVDVIEKLTEVPARWPIPPDASGTNTAYVIDLNNDKKWQELDINSKNKKLDCFVKQEVSLTFIALTLHHWRDTC
jgi:hypothetical protein